MDVVIDQNIFTTLDNFFASKTVTDADRNTYSICNLKDTINKIRISLVFLRDWDSLESDSYSQVIIENKGAVFTFPCYWLSIPKELTIPYFTYIIEAFYQDEVSKWKNSNSTNSGGTGNNNFNNNCCRPSCGIV